MANTVEKVASGAMGAAKDAKAAIKGLSGVFKLLMEEHGKVSALIKRVGATSDEDTRARLYPEIRRELLAHETGELRAVYPALTKHPETAAIASEHADQASELQTAIAEVDALAVSDPAWPEAFGRLRRLVDEHVQREESEYFPKAQRVLGEERLEQLRSAFEAAKPAP